MNDLGDDDSTSTVYVFHSPSPSKLTHTFFSAVEQHQKGERFNVKISPKIQWNSTPVLERIRKSKIKFDKSHQDSDSSSTSSLKCKKVANFLINECSIQPSQSRSLIGKKRKYNQSEKECKKQSSLIDLWLSSTTSTVNQIAHSITPSSPTKNTQQSIRSERESSLTSVAKLDKQTDKSKSTADVQNELDALTACLQDEQVFDDFFSEISCEEKQSKIDSELPLSFSTKYATFTVSFVEQQHDGSKFVFVAERRDILIVLKDGWIDVDVEPMDCINIFTPYNTEPFHIESNAVITLDYSFKMLLILNPHLLLTGTSISDSVACVRRAVLSSTHLVDNDMNGISLPLFYGSILHEVFQACLVEFKFDPSFISTQIKQLLDDHVEELFFLNLSIDEAKIEIEKISSRGFALFFENFISQLPSSSPSNAQQKKGENLFIDYSTDSFGKTNTSKKRLSVQSVIDIEENIWSHMYGIKGKIDATITAKEWIDGSNDHSRSSTEYLAPFELKTGKKISNSSHTAQVMLYTLLLSDRYNVQIKAALLCYLNSGELLKIPGNLNEIGSLIIARNKVAGKLKGFRKHSILPEKISSDYTCRYCPVRSVCNTYEELYNEIEDSHCSVSCSDNLLRPFFDHWLEFLRREEGEAIALKNSIWLDGNEGRIRKGRSIIHVKLANMEKLEDRFYYSFTKSTTSNKLNCIIDCQIFVGDSVIVSVASQIGVLIGFVNYLSEEIITISTDMKLKKSFFEEESFRIDKDEILSAFSIARSNLVNFASSTNSIGVYSNYLQNIVLNRQLDEKLIDYGSPMDTTHLLLDDSLNEDQLNVLKRVVSLEENSFLLIHGMPGTGKTTTISKLISSIIQRGKRVLLVAYTHTAVDNVLLKFSTCMHVQSEKVVRIGRRDKISNFVFEKYSPLSRRFTSIDACREFYANAQVVASTCLGLNHPLIQRESFDICIVDEASQILLPLCLGPLMRAKSFILVGDQCQLPPIVINEELRGNSILSLFEQLTNSFPERILNLKIQYRMNQEIMTISNKLFYRGLLVCGNDQVKEQSINLEDVGGCRECKSNSFDGNNLVGCYYCFAMRMNVSFINIFGYHEIRVGDTIKNHTEASIIHSIITKMIGNQSIVKECNVGIIAPYKAQIKHISSLLLSYQSIEKYTIDKYQGREKDVVIVSFVRSNPDGYIGELLSDWKRLNVAFTRSRKKLILVGSIQTLLQSGCTLYKELFELLQSMDCIFDLHYEY